ncbi:hypothetical protein B0H13DRAFT_834141 [Mycena leptocephala]|nr:hypothetical protein B0H13DRAFT_834141 [Mycena leptocephala]
MASFQSGLGAFPPSFSTSQSIFFRGFIYASTTSFLMSTSPTTNDASPGGEIQNIMPFDDRDGRSMSDYSWSSAGKLASRPIVKFCVAHGPHDDCYCELTCSPQTPPSDCTTRSRGSDATVSSRGSDATIDEIFERPYADPKVSPAQLPPLCDDTDSDDELFYATNDPDGADDFDGPCPTPGLDLLSKTSSWIADLHAEPPTEKVELPRIHFTFMAPSNAPRFPSPLHVEGTPVSTIKTLALVASLALNKPRYHPRPSSDSEHFEPNQSVVSYLQRPGIRDGENETAMHTLLLKNSQRIAGSYSSAPKCIQRSVRALMTTFPWIRVDFVTPFEAFPCAFSECDILIPTNRKDAENHIKDFHSLAAHGLSLSAQRARRGC